MILQFSHVHTQMRTTTRREHKIERRARLHRERKKYNKLFIRYTQQLIDI